jgi:TatD DNase family protein
MTVLVDSHCHLSYDFSPKSADDLVREAQESGVQYLVAIGTDLENTSTLHLLSERYPGVVHTIGVHPHDASALGPSDLKTLRTRASHPLCRAIGEIGLDYHYEHSPRTTQIQDLQAQLELALELKLPVVVHSREAEEDLLPRLEHYARQARMRPGQPVGVIHCFTGTQAFGSACLDAGFLISFSGILTFKNSDSLRDCARTYPLDRLMIETDSPYLAPVPHRGKKCEPAWVRFTAMKLAEIKGVTLDEVAEITTRNACALFRLGERS